MATVPLTQEQLEHLRLRLENERERLLAVVHAPIATVAPDDERTEMEEEAQRATERTARIVVRDHERVLLGEVERALAKLRAGTYGLGETTGEPIAYERLDAVPWARDDADEPGERRPPASRST